MKSSENHRSQTRLGPSRRCILQTLLVLIPTTNSLARNGGSRAKCIGGSLPGLPQSSSGEIDATNRYSFRFISDELEVAVPWDKINLLEYGQKIRKRIGLTLFVSPLFWLTKTKKHFLTISFQDEDGQQQVLLFQIHKSDVRVALATLQARTGLNVEFQDEQARLEGENQ